MPSLDITLTTPDGFHLAATHFLPDEPNGLAVLINSATGAPRHYYRHFADYLAALGCQVLTYDYRGIGDSQDLAFNSDTLRLRDWASQDLATALDWLAAQPGASYIAGVGHSIGGQLMGLAPNNHRFNLILTIASQIGYWRNWPTLTGRLKMKGVTGIAMPAVVRAFGKLPGFAMGGVSLPAGIALEWARWCQHEAYFVDEDGQPLPTHFGQFTGAARFYAIADDHFYAPHTAVRNLYRRYIAATGEMVVRHPLEWGAQKMGHFGFFRRDTPRAAWDEVAGWLLRETALASPLPLIAA